MLNASESLPMDFKKNSIFNMAMLELPLYLYLMLNIVILQYAERVFHCLENINLIT